MPGAEKKQRAWDVVFATVVVVAVLAGSLGCSGESTMALTLRADAVEPSRQVDVTISLDGQEERRTGVGAGELIEMGAVPVGTSVRFEVTNSHGAGQVRANILTNNCFRETSSCSGAGCVARAEYRVESESCPNL